MGDIQKPDKKKNKVLDTQESHVATSEEKKSIYNGHVQKSDQKKNKTNELPINGTHSCYIYIYCGRLYSLALTPLKHQQHFYYINKKI